MQRSRVLFALLLVACLAIPAAAQFWTKKSYDKWSKNECKDMLTKSPWAGQYRHAVAVQELISSSSSITGAPLVEGRESPYVTYTAKFMSARPIREAMIRMQQLDAKYEKLTPEKKAAFDEQAKKFLDMPFADQIVIQLSYETIQTYRIPLSRYWKSLSQDELRQKMSLFGDEGKVTPAQVIVSDGPDPEFQLFFPRVHDGKPLVTSASKEIALEVFHPEVKQPERDMSPQQRTASGVGTPPVLPAVRVFINFPVKKMMSGDQPVY